MPNVAEIACIHCKPAKPLPKVSNDLNTDFLNIITLKISLRIWKISSQEQETSDSFMCRWGQAWKQQICRKICANYLSTLSPNCLIEYCGNTNRPSIKTICHQMWKSPDGFHNRMCSDIRSCELLSPTGGC